MDMICTVITSGNITEELLLLLVMLKRVSHFTSGSHSWFTLLDRILRVHNL